MTNNDISFARKYRPTSLKNYIGNGAVKETVIRYLKANRPQTILLTGNSGCGKTTLARILAKEYMCEDRDSETGACGECMTCMSMEEYITTGDMGNVSDIFEIDASSNSGKRQIDSVLSNVEYPPVAGDWKVYIIDEIHLLTEQAMGRLLKIVEEPPDYVLFIFCTTNPNKLLPTLKNRCQLKLNITKPTMNDVINLLERVCLNEDVPYDKVGLRLLAGRNNGVIRDTLNDVERVLKTRESATGEAVSTEFREISDKILFEFYDAYLNKNYMQYINILYTIKTTYSFEQFLVSLTNFTVRGIYILNGIDVDGVSPEELKNYMKLFKKVEPAQISYILSSLKGMDMGDIEANFMSFIYTDISKPLVNQTTTVKTSDSSNSEVKFRNSNLEKIELAKLAKGSKSLGKEMEQVGMEGLGDLFNLEKVNN